MNNNQGNHSANRAAVETAVTVRVGLDVHATMVAMCVQVDGATPQPAQTVGREEVVERLERLKQKYPGARVVSCYEAGPLGYDLHRQLAGAGIANWVVVPQALGDGRRQKTDRLDARALAERLERYERGNRRAMSVVRVPTREQEQARAKVRLREQLARTRRQHESRGRSLLLTQGIRVPGPWWRPGPWAQLAPRLPAWLRELVSVWQQQAEAADRQEQVIRAELSATHPPWLPRGVGALTWQILSREILDWSRFTNRRQVASYTGLCPGVHQSGKHRRELCINRHGNPAIRHALVELAWRLTRWQPGYPPVRRLLEPGLAPRRRRQLVVAAARRLAIDLWRLATGQTTPEKLGLNALPVN